MPNGYAGRILHVDLTSGTLTVENPPESFYRQYLGGSAMGVYYILKNQPARTAALSPESVFTIMLSPLTGAPISGQSRATVNAKSPLVDGIGDSQMGGFFPAESGGERLTNYLQGWFSHYRGFGLVVAAHQSHAFKTFASDEKWTVRRYQDLRTSACEFYENTR